MSEEELNKWRKKTKGIYHIVRYNQFWNYIDNLKDISKDREEYEYGLEQHLKELENKIDKAIEYIKEDIKANYFKRYDDEVYKMCDDLLEILGDKE